MSFFCLTACYLCTGKFGHETYTEASAGLIVRYTGTRALGEPNSEMGIVTEFCDISQCDQRH